MMRSFKLVQLSVCVLATLIAGAGSSRADWPPGRHMAESMAINLAIGSSIESKSGFGFLDTCYLGAFIQPGNDSFLTMQLDSSEEYLFVGAARQGCDLDISVEDSGRRIVARDQLADNNPVVRFSPAYSGKYTLRLKLHSANQAQFCGMVLLKKGGWSVSVDRLGAAGSSVLQLCEQVARRRKAKFLDVPGEWAIVGQVMRPGESTSVSGIRLGAGRRVVLAAGDASSHDIDLLVSRDTRLPAQLVSDTRVNNDPLVDLHASESSSYSIETNNVRSSGATIVMTALLDID